MKMTVAERAMAARSQLLNKAIKSSTVQQASSISSSPSTMIAVDGEPCMPVSKNNVSSQADIDRYNADTLQTIAFVPEKNDAQFSTKTKDFATHEVTHKNNAPSSIYIEKIEWSASDLALIHWFESLTQEQLPKTPFQLTPWITVTGPLFFIRLKESIEAGPNGPRTLYGALQDDLKKLKEKIETKI